MAPATNWLSFSLTPAMDNVLRSSSDHTSHSPFPAAAAAVDPTPQYYLDNFYTNGWSTNPKAQVLYGEVEQEQTNDLASFNVNQPIPKLEDFLGDSWLTSSTTQDSSTLTSQVYDVVHGGSGYYNNNNNSNQDFKAAITGFQAFSSNSGASDVDDSASVARSSVGRNNSEFVGGSNNVQSSNGEKAIVAMVESDQSKKVADTFGQRTSIYRGVTRHRWTGRYEAHLWDNSCRREGQARKGRQVYLGGYDMEDKAARSYDLAALKYWGSAATTNFPVSTYTKEVEDMKVMTKQEFIASLRRKSSGFSRGASKYRGVTRHHQQGRWQARIGRVAGNKDLYLGTFATEEEAAEAYDIAAIKFRGINAVTNFEMNRYDVEAISKSSLPVGSSAKRLKISLESEEHNQSLTDRDHQLQHSQCSSGSNSNTINFSHSMAQPVQTIPCGISYDHAAALYHHKLLQQYQSYNFYPSATDSSAGSHLNIGTGQMTMPMMPQQQPSAEFFLWPQYHHS